MGHGKMDQTKKSKKKTFTRREAMLQKSTDISSYKLQSIERNS